MSEGWEPTQDAVGTRRLGRRAASGLKWTIIEIWGRQALNFAVFIVLARLLTPADFGVVALAMVFSAFAQLFVDQGLGDALIQKRNLTRGHIDTAFWSAVVLGVILTALIVAAAPLIAALLGEPGLAPILQVLSLTFILAGFSTIQMDLLRRELAFARLALRTVVATLGGGIAGVAMAVAGFGPWALVGQQLAIAVLSVVMLWRVSPWSPRLYFSRQYFRELFGFGVNVVGADALNYIGRNADNLLVGAVLGAGPLGLYAVGYRILEVTQTVLVNVIRRISFPILARIQRDEARLRRAYMRLTRLASLVVLPGYVGLAILAPDLVSLVFGSRWAASGPVAAILLLIGPVLVVQAFSTALLNAIGRPQIVLRFRLLTTVVNVLGFVIAVPFGIYAVAVAYTVRGYLLAPVILIWMRTHAGIPIGAYLLQFRPALMSTLALAIVMVVAGLGLSEVWPLGATVAAQAALGVLAYVATLTLVRPDQLRELATVAAEVVPGVSRVARGLQRARHGPGEG